MFIRAETLRLHCSIRFSVRNRAKILQRPEPQVTVAKSTSDGTSISFRKGIVFALMAQILWGMFPIYLKLLRPTPAMDIVAHRVAWSFVFLILLTWIGSQFRLKGWPRWSELAEQFRSSKAMGQLLAASILIAVNWIGFVLAISLDRTIDASIGYYICPQVVVLLGVIFKNERLSPMQWIAFWVTSLGVLVMAGSESGIPWLGLTVAFSFGFYALTKKYITCQATTSLTFETGFLFLPAAAFLMWGGVWFSAEVAAEPEISWISPLGLQLLLVFSGIATVLPLLLYVSSVKYLPLSLVGVFQFLGPTIQFGLSVFVFDEPLDWPRLVGIFLIWTGVLFFLRGARQASSPDCPADVN